MENDSEILPSQAQQHYGLGTEISSQAAPPENELNGNLQQNSTHVQNFEFQEAHQENNDTDQDFEVSSTKVDNRIFLFCFLVSLGPPILKYNSILFNL